MVKLWDQKVLGEYFGLTVHSLEVGSRKKADMIYQRFMSERYRSYGNVPLIEPVRQRIALASSASRGHDEP